MRVVSRTTLVRVSMLVVGALVAFFAAAAPARAAGGTELLTNGGFDASGGSLSGWSATKARLTLASDGDGGTHAALVALNGKKSATYGLSTSSPVVASAPAGERFTGNGKVRSATPGKSVCLLVRERTPSGSTARTATTCTTTTASWASFTATTLTVGASGDTVVVTVQQSSGAGGDSFEVDSLSLVDPDVTAPTTPTGVTASAASATAVDLSWSASTDAGGNLTSYVVYRGGARVATVSAPATAYRDSTVSAGTSYSYTVSAVDFAGNESSPSTAAPVTTPPTTTDSPPTAPTGLSATAVSSVEVDLSWSASTDADSTGVAGYAVSRDGSTIATVGASATTYVDSGVGPSTTYSYTVTAFDTANNYSAPSGAASATTPAAPAPGVVDDVWHMDETSGTTMVDSGQTPHPGALHSVVLGQPGDVGTSYGFNGTSSYIDVGNADDLNAGSKDVHIALSLNTTTVPPSPDYDLFRKGQYPGTEYKLELQPNGQFSCEFRTLQSDGSTVKGYTIQPAIDLHDGQWHRLTCSKVGGTMTVTVDGVAFTKSITGTISNTYHVIIGAYSPTGGGDYYQGRLDEVSFHLG